MTNISKTLMSSSSLVALGYDPTMVVSCKYIIKMQFDPENIEQVLEI